MPLEHDPTFNLKAVLRETRLKADTIRAWERRYGLPMPQRSAGGHRLYSQRDIDSMKWLIARQAEGLSISRAVQLWRRLEADGQDPLQAPALSLSQTPGRAYPAVPGNALAETRQSWINACLGFDEQGAESALAQGFAVQRVEVVCHEVLQKGLAEIGDAWYQGVATVQQEHFASALAIRRLESLLAAAPPPSRPARILVACPQEELHGFASLLVALLLRRRGWDVTYLGEDVPVEQLERTMEMARSSMVVLTAQMLHTAANLRDMALIVEKARLTLGFGGYIFRNLPELRRTIPGHYLGDHLHLAAQAIEDILANPRSRESVKPISRTYLRALAHVRDHLPLIEADVLKATQSMPVPQHKVTDANANLAMNITAALRLGNVAFLGHDMGWLEGLLPHHGLPPGHFQRYLGAYQKACVKRLDDRAKPVKDWLASMLAKG